jgi:hypothetical protein
LRVLKIEKISPTADTIDVSKNPKSNGLSALV